MVAKYPALSLVSVLGMSVAIAIGALVFGGASAMLDTTLPLEDGDRIVAVQIERADAPENLDRQVPHDFDVWRTALTTVRDLGAFQLGDRNLIVRDGGRDGVADVVAVAEMSAAGFRVARVPPLSSCAPAFIASAMHGFSSRAAGEDGSASVAACRAYFRSSAFSARSDEDALRAIAASSASRMPLFPPSTPPRSPRSSARWRAV